MADRDQQSNLHHNKDDEQSWQPITLKPKICKKLSGVVTNDVIEVLPPSPEKPTSSRSLLKQNWQNDEKQNVGGGELVPSEHISDDQMKQLRKELLRKKRAAYKHQCIICKKYFKRKSPLTKHMRTHNGQKPYKCRACYKSFADPSNYKRHLRQHDEHTQLAGQETTVAIAHRTADDDDNNNSDTQLSETNDFLLNGLTSAVGAAGNATAVTSAMALALSPPNT